MRILVKLWNSPMIWNLWSAASCRLDQVRQWTWLSGFHRNEHLRCWSFCMCVCVQCIILRRATPAVPVAAPPLPPSLARFLSKRRLPLSLSIRPLRTQAVPVCHTNRWWIVCAHLFQMSCALSELAPVSPLCRFSMATGASFTVTREISDIMEMPIPSEIPAEATTAIQESAVSRATSTLSRPIVREAPPTPQAIVRIGPPTTGFHRGNRGPPARDEHTHTRQMKSSLRLSHSSVLFFFYTPVCLSDLSSVLVSVVLVSVFSWASSFISLVSRKKMLFHIPDDQH